METKSNLKNILQTAYHIFNNQLGKLIFRTAYPPSKSELKKFIYFLNKKHPEIEVKLLDIGARGGIGHSHETLLKLNNLWLEGIEPDKKEAKALESSYDYGNYKKVHAIALSNKTGIKNLYVTQGIGCTSLYEPNMEILKYFTFSPRFEVKKIEKIKTETLDTLYFGKKDFSFIKMDVQGSEYDIIESGEKIIKNLIGLSLEAHFFEFYKGQKLFSDIHDLLSKNNFMLIRIDLRSIDGLAGEASNCVYIKNHALIKTKEQLLKHILFALLWNKKDYAEFLLRNYGKKFLNFSEREEIINQLKIVLRKKENPLKFAYDGAAFKYKKNFL